MIRATELWVQTEDGRQQVVRIDGDGVAVRELREPPPAPDLPPLPERSVAAIADIIAELRDDAEAIGMRGESKLADYARVLAARLTAAMGDSGGQEPD